MGRGKGARQPGPVRGAQLEQHGVEVGDVLGARVLGLEQYLGILLHQPPAKVAPCPHACSVSDRTEAIREQEQVDNKAHRLALLHRR
jgi:hypothetical protein